MKKALICFLKFPEPGHVKTRLAVDISPESAAELYTCLVERIITEIFPLEEAYDILLYVDSTHPVSQFQAWLGDQWTFKTQEYGDLGQRLEAAFSETFKVGYDRVMVIGSDCVGMDESFIAQAFSQLDDHELVIGPSSDGGYYLLGMSEEQPWIFEDIPWSTDQVLNISLSRCEAREVRFHELEEKLDIDDSADLDRFRKSLPDTHFLARKIDQIVVDAVSRLDKDGEVLDLLSPEHYRTQVLSQVEIAVEEPDPEEEITPAPAPAASRDGLNLQNLFGARAPVGNHGKKPGR